MADDRGGTPSPLGSAARLFDALGLVYERAYGQLPGQLEALDWLLHRLPARARVLDIGSGTGRPVAERLAAAGHLVTGCDVSPTMVRLARAQVPLARFELADVRELPDTPGAWDAITAFFPLFQLPRTEMELTLTRVADWLAPGGSFVLATVPFDGEGLELTWLGQRVRCSGYPAEIHPKLIEAAGLDVVHARCGVFRPDFPGAGEEEHLFVHAVKPQ
ncbi:SAM-dependent methyltransferase [Kitasatospora sp. MMS16-BH015]|uniref:class I SAM-dependent methyltransferase n=1 Tax=Kitasatospora sp. MMS16-BH015 TaxID=2018025 RepID=UPI000CA38E66|nr:class I SAM-dependent methyltransferase [Kitasatospora sp. MMS16-BH015]AUG80491.1 SAM-dependent methyltransferase [Kitasatospora sp. MMS16-BH015]